MLCWQTEIDARGDRDRKRCLGEGAMTNHSARPGPQPAVNACAMAKAALRAIWIAALTMCFLASGRLAAQERAFDFALIGDMPYTRVQEQEYQRVLAALNAADLAFVAHIGDFQFDARPYNQNPSIASMPCVDENYKAIYESFQSVRHPFILTPGDNDWTDCWPLQAKKVDPLELLAKVRTMFFPEGRDRKSVV